jgi:phosphoglycolate phosphatase-like HAD superfamily hydrolase
MDDTARTSIVPQTAARSVGGPLVVDLDGSLIRTDTTVENLVAIAKRPLLLLRALFAWRHGRARLKQELAAAAEFDPAALPYNEALLGYLREQHAAGRVLVLATGADRSTAEAVARHLGLFDLVLASDGQVNLTGRAKLAAIRNSLGDGPFTYVGNSRTDLRVWHDAAGAICVGVRPRVARAAARATTVERSFASDDGARALVRALRPHQWAKNLLVFVPLIAARAIGDLPGWGAAGLIFLAFCLTASGIYLVNDLCDLAADRRHPSKSRRPFASGALPVQWGLLAAPLLLLAGLVLGATVGALSLLLIYAACSFAVAEVAAAGRRVHFGRALWGAAAGRR